MKIEMQIMIMVVTEIEREINQDHQRSIQKGPSHSWWVGVLSLLETAVLPFLPCGGREALPTLVRRDGDRLMSFDERLQRLEARLQLLETFLD